MSTHFSERKSQSPGTILHDLFPIIALIISPVCFSFFPTHFASATLISLLLLQHSFAPEGLLHTVLFPTSTQPIPSWAPSPGSRLTFSMTPSLTTLTPHFWSSSPHFFFLFHISGLLTYYIMCLLLLITYSLCPQQNVSITRPVNCVWNNV